MFRYQNVITIHTLQLSKCDICRLRSTALIITNYLNLKPAKSNPLQKKKEVHHAKIGLKYFVAVIPKEGFFWYDTAYDITCEYNRVQF